MLTCVCKLIAETIDKYETVNTSVDWASLTKREDLAELIIHNNP